MRNCIFKFLEFIFKVIVFLGLNVFVIYCFFFVKFCCLVLDVMNYLLIVVILKVNIIVKM